MSRNRLSMRLKPIGVEGCQSTWISLSGPVQTTEAAAEIEALIAILRRWNNGRLRVVLSADGAASWHEPWEERLAALPEPQVEVRSRRSQASGQAATREVIDERQLTLFRA